MKKMPLLFGLALLFLLSGCPAKEEFPVIIPVGFVLPVTITPTSRTTQVGDTLWLEADYSDSLVEKNSGRRYRVRPQDLAFTSYVNYKHLLGQGQEPVGVARSFRIVEQLGRAPIGGSTSGLFVPVYDGRRYRARIGLIPTRRGVTAISMSVTAGGWRAHGQFLPFLTFSPDAQGREQKAVLDESHFVINDGQANNFSLFAQHVRAFSLEPGTPMLQVLYEQKGTFTVDVR